MKKILVILMAILMLVGIAACTNDNTETTEPTKAPSTTDAPENTAEPAPTEKPDDPDTKSEGVMTYAEYIAAANDSQVVVEVYVQDHQSWWDNKITVYAADRAGAYFLYNMACSEEDAAKLVPGTKLKVTGYKSEWAGEIEIIDATFEIEEGTYIAEPVDVTALLGTEELAAKMNAKASFKDLVVVASKVSGDAKDYAFLYKWDNSGERGDDLYFNVSDGKNVYTFTVESYLKGKDTDVYKAVEAFKIGDVVDLEGFLYWYNGVNPHITSAAVKSNVNAKSEGVMTYAEYAAAANDTKVVVEAYVQDHQSWWDNKITVYAEDADGAYFFYNMACSEEDAAKLVPGTKIKVTGYKSEWSGEVEIIDASFEIEEGKFISVPEDVTALLGTDDLITKMNKKVAFKNLTIAASKVSGDETEYAFLYKWDNSGEQGDDLYFNVTDGKATYTFTVESYLRGKDTEVYKAVEALKVGDTVDLEGFLYWYNGANPHITAVTVK